MGFRVVALVVAFVGVFATPAGASRLTHRHPIYPSGATAADVSHVIGSQQIDYHLAPDHELAVVHWTAHGTGWVTWQFDATTSRGPGVECQGSVIPGLGFVPCSGPRYINEVTEDTDHYRVVSVHVGPHGAGTRGRFEVSLPPTGTVWVLSPSLPADAFGARYDVGVMAVQP